ncbi:MAG: hypothetical protein ACI4U2_01020, partial [Christensenellaceae bacterium]
VYLICLAFLRLGFMEQSWYLGYVIPGVFVVLDLFTFMMLLCRMTNSATFLFTNILNGILSFVLAILNGFSVISFPPYGSLCLFLSGGLSVLFILDFIIFHILSATNWLSGRL